MQKVLDFSRINKMKVLITGGAGFIGSHVTELFCDLGYSVTVVDDLRFGYERFVDSRAKFVKGSIGDSDLMEKVLEEVGVVIHLAASSIISFSYEDPVGYFQNNLTNGLVLLEAMRKKGLTKAEKRGEREAQAGVVSTYNHDNRIGVVIEVNCETDFVARNEIFTDLVKDVAMHIAASSPLYVSSDDVTKVELCWFG
jgi:NAD dependent epimerase/dehydratase family enzyme